MTRDLCYITNVGNSLRKLDLSSNRIYFLPDYGIFQQMVELEFLLLHGNQIVGWQQLECIMGTRNLHVLTLMGNPCAKINGYRKYMIESKPSLWALDEFVIQDFERKEYATLYPRDVFKANRLNELKRFRPHNPESAKFTTATAPQDHRLYLQGAEADRGPAFLSLDFQFIAQQLQQEHYNLRRRFEYCSPILTIQKTVKAWLVRKRYRSKLILLPKLFNNLFTWYKRYNLVRLMRGLNLTPERLYRIGKVRFLQRLFKRILHRERIMNGCGLRFTAFFHMRQAQNVMLPWALGLCAQYPYSKRIKKERRNAGRASHYLFGVRQTQVGTLSQTGKILGNLVLKRVELERRKSLRAARMVKIEETPPESDCDELKWTKPQLRRFDQDQVPSLIFNLEQFEKKIDPLAAKIRELVYHYAISDKDVKDSRFKTEARIRSTDYSNSPVLSLVRMVKRLIQERKNEDRKKRPLYPTPGQSLVQSPFKIRPRHHTRKYTYNKMKSFKKRISTNQLPPFERTNITDDTLIQFNFKSKLHVYEIIYEIIRRNRTAQQPFFVFYGPFMQFGHSVITIQAWIRGTMLRNRKTRVFNKYGRPTGITFPFTVRNTRYSDYVIVLRAVRLIQNAVRFRRIRCRINCLASIASYVADIRTHTTLYMAESNYLAIEQLVHEVQEDIAKEGRIGGGFHERESTVTVNAKTNRLQMKNVSEQSVHRYKLHNFPLWFAQTATTTIPFLLPSRVVKLDSVGEPPRKAKSPRSPKKPQPQREVPEVDILQILHQTGFDPKPLANPDLSDPAPCQVTYADIIREHDQFSEEKGKLMREMPTFIRFSYRTNTEAKHRAIAVALLTAKYLQGADEWLHFFSREMLATDPKKCLTHINKIGGRIISYQKEEDASLLQLHELQRHDGIITKAESYIKTMLRARPRGSKIASDKMISLKGASQEMIAERLEQYWVKPSGPGLTRNLEQMSKYNSQRYYSSQLRQERNALFPEQIYHMENPLQQQLLNETEKLRNKNKNEDNGKNTRAIVISRHQYLYQKNGKELHSPFKLKRPGSPGPDPAANLLNDSKDKSPKELDIKPTKLQERPGREQNAQFILPPNITLGLMINQLTLPEEPVQKKPPPLPKVFKASRLFPREKTIVHSRIESNRGAVKKGRKLNFKEADTNRSDAKKKSPGVVTLHINEFKSPMISTRQIKTKKEVELDIMFDKKSHQPDDDGVVTIEQNDTGRRNQNLSVKSVDIQHQSPNFSDLKDMKSNEDTEHIEGINTPAVDSTLDSNYYRQLSSEYMIGRPLPPKILEHHRGSEPTTDVQGKGAIQKKVQIGKKLKMPRVKLLSRPNKFKGEKNPLLVTNTIEEQKANRSIGENSAPAEFTRKRSLGPVTPKITKAKQAIQLKCVSPGNTNLDSPNVKTARMMETESMLNNVGKTSELEQRRGAAAAESFFGKRESNSGLGQQLWKYPKPPSRSIVDRRAGQKKLRESFARPDFQMNTGTPQSKLKGTPDTMLQAAGFGVTFNPATKSASQPHLVLDNGQPGQMTERQQPKKNEFEKEVINSFIGHRVNWKIEKLRKKKPPEPTISEMIMKSKSERNIMPLHGSHHVKITTKSKGLRQIMASGRNINNMTDGVQQRSDIFPTLYTNPGITPVSQATQFKKQPSTFKEFRLNVGSNRPKKSSLNHEDKHMTEARDTIEKQQQLRPKNSVVQSSMMPINSMKSGRGSSIMDLFQQAQVPKVKISKPMTRNESAQLTQQQNTMNYSLGNAPDGDHQVVHGLNKKNKQQQSLPSMFTMVNPAIQAHPNVFNFNITGGAQMRNSKVIKTCTSSVYVKRTKPK